MIDLRNVEFVAVNAARIRRYIAGNIKLEPGNPKVEAVSQNHQADVTAVITVLDETGECSQAWLGLAGSAERRRP
jgi:hypothetical protein